MILANQFQTQIKALRGSRNQRNKVENVAGRGESLKLLKIFERTRC